MKKGIVALLTLLLVFVCVSSTVADTIRIKEGYKPNIRLKPSTDAKILRQAKPGEKFELLGSSGTWYRIRLGYNMFGWIAGKT